MTSDETQLIENHVDTLRHVIEALCWLIGTMILVILAQIGVKLVIWRKVILLLRRANLMLKAAQIEGKMTDREAARAESFATQTQGVIKDHERHMLSAVEQAASSIPDRTADAVMAKMKDSGDSVNVPPTNPT